MCHKIKRPADLSIVKRLGGFSCCKSTNNFSSRNGFDENNRFSFLPKRKFAYFCHSTKTSIYVKTEGVILTYTKQRFEAVLELQFTTFVFSRTPTQRQVSCAIFLAWKTCQSQWVWQSRVQASDISTFFSFQLFIVNQHA